MIYWYLLGSSLVFGYKKILLLTFIVYYHDVLSIYIAIVLLFQQLQQRRRRPGEPLNKAHFVHPEKLDQLIKYVSGMYQDMR